MTQRFRDEESLGEASLLEQLGDPIRGVQDWERRTRYKTPGDAQIEAFYAEQLLLLSQTDAVQQEPSEASRTWLSRWVPNGLLSGWRLSALAAAVCGVVLAVALGGSLDDDRLTFTVSGDSGASAPGVVQRWLEEPEPQLLSFSDGTRVTLTGGTRAQVQQTTDRGAQLELRDGAAKLDVIPQEGYRWGVVAGPFLVTVKGTIFDVAWDPQNESLQVQVERGSVSVTGGHLNAEMLLLKGQRLVASGDGQTRLSYGDDSAAEQTSNDSSEEPALEPEELPQEVTQAGKAAASTGEQPSPTDKVAPAETADQLLKRADAARANGQGGEATRLLMQVRQRFPGSSQASLAAYTLGVNAFMHRGSSMEGARWFQTYLRESPGGPLAREALGQLMEAQARMGDKASARTSARRYLERYPSGPHRHAAQMLSGH